MNDTIRVLLVKPMQTPQVAEIPSDLKGMQNTVGGYIEAVYPFEEPVAIVCDEESKLCGKQLNRALRDESGEIYDIIAGDFFICGLGEENFLSLSDEQIKKYGEMFKTPEFFVKVNGKIASIPLVSNSPVKKDNGAR